MTMQNNTLGAMPIYDADDIVSRRRRNRIKRNLLQISIIAVACLAVIGFAMAVANGLARHGVSFSFDFLWNVAHFDISEGKTLVFENGWWPSLVEFTSSNTIAQAFVAGFYNTLKVALVAIVLSTILGTMLGVGRLSSNWLVRNLSFGIVEFIRNTPLLIQLVFWYFGVVVHFPPMSAAAHLYGGIIVSQQGLYLPALVAAQGATAYSAVFFIVGILFLLAAVVTKIKRRRWAFVTIGALLLAVSLQSGLPITLEFPVANRFQATGGTSMSPEMAALLLAVVVNSAAYIAEIVRGAIESIPRGQWEAASSLGFSRKITLNDIILPQVFRVVLPSFTNQYISLAKNTALGIAIGYPELFNVYGTIANQTGRSLEGIVIVMVVYLLLSWTISLAVNLINSRVNAQGAMR